MKKRLVHVCTIFTVTVYLKVDELASRKKYEDAPPSAAQKFMHNFSSAFIAKSIFQMRFIVP